MYFIIGAVLVVLCVIGLILYDAAQDNQEAQAKAAPARAAVRTGRAPRARRHRPARRRARDDGGAVCANPANALGKAILADQITNGASFVGRRPVIFDRRFVVGEALILQIYCPEELPAYQEKVDELKFDDTIKP